MALQAALADIAKWEPPPNAERLVLKAEAHLATLPVDSPAVWTAQVNQAPRWGGGAQ